MLSSFVIGHYSRGPESFTKSPSVTHQQCTVVVSSLPVVLLVQCAQLRRQCMLLGRGGGICTALYAFSVHPACPPTVPSMPQAPLKRGSPKKPCGDQGCNCGSVAVVVVGFWGGGNGGLLSPFCPLPPPCPQVLPCSESSHLHKSLPFLPFLATPVSRSVGPTKKIPFHVLLKGLFCLVFTVHKTCVLVKF